MKNASEHEFIGGRISYSPQLKPGFFWFLPLSFWRGFFPFIFGYFLGRSPNRHFHDGSESESDSDHKPVTDSVGVNISKHTP